MKRICVTIASIALSLSVYANPLDDLFIVQSRSVHDIYGLSIANRLKERFPSASIEVLTLRDFDVDRFTQSRHVVLREVELRIQNHSNLVLIGHELSGLNVGFVNQLIIPSLLGVSGIGAATPSEFIRLGERARSYVPSSRAVYYILSDPSTTSQLRLREWQRLAAEDRSFRVVPYTVTRVSELRAALISINSSALEQGVILHNIFSLVDGDTFRLVYSDFIDSLIVDYNTRHIEMGVLKSNQTLAIGVGAGPSAVADAIERSVYGEASVTLDTQIGVNLGRLSTLRLTEFLIQEGEKFSYIGVHNGD